jgi:DNA-binding transcriptional LysR family regulator
VEGQEIRAFLTLAEEQHFGRAAQRLHVSTARVSQLIKKLERRVGVPLFERTSRKVALTPVGRQLNDDLRPAFEQIQRAMEQAITAGRGTSGTLNAGFAGAAAGRLVLQAARVFGDRHPDCEVQIREIPGHGCFGPLRTGEIDLMLTCFPVCEPDLRTGPVLIREPRMLAVSSAHPFALRVSASVEDLASDTVLRPSVGTPDYWDEHCVPRQTPDGKIIQRGQVTETFQEMLALIAAGEGIHPVGAQAARYYARPDVSFIPFRDAPPFEWGLVWHAERETSRLRDFSLAACSVSGEYPPE